ncbi:hypothetical protein Bca4012_014042 [Brassica carinata]
MSTGEEAQIERGSRKRRVGAKNGGKKNKKFKTLPPSSNRFKPTKKDQKLFQKRRRGYNSDEDEEEDESKKTPEVTIREKIFTDANMGPNYDEVEEEEGSDKDENSDGEDHGEIQSGITRFGDEDGCNAFKMAFKAIMKKTKGEDALGPVFVKEAKKRSILLGVRENENRLQVVCVTKPSAFDESISKLAQKASNSNDDEAPAWAPLRDNYMLANPKLKDWDKKQEISEGDDFAAMSGDESYED